MRGLDPEAVEAFVLIADLRRFTRAAGVLNSTQAAVSLKLKRLEERLGQRLLTRTPRLVTLSAAGEVFLPAARDLVAAHRRAEQAFEGARVRLALGITHHIVGADLPGLMRRRAGFDGGLTLELHIDGTRKLLDLYDAGDLDAVIVLQYDESRREGEALSAQSFHWYGSSDLVWQAGVPLPLATQAETCSLREMAVRSLDAAGIAWREVVVGGGAMAIGAAAAAGLAVTAMADRVAPAGTVDLGPALGLPELPKRRIMLHSRIGDAWAGRALRAIAAHFRSPQAGAAALAG